MMDDWSGEMGGWSGEKGKGGMRGGMMGDMKERMMEMMKKMERETKFYMASGPEDKCDNVPEELHMNYKKGGCMGVSTVHKY